MNSLQALRRAQAAYDAQVPDCSAEVEDDYITQQVDLLLAGEDAELIGYFDFLDEAAATALHYDEGHLVAIVLTVLRDDYARAKEFAGHFKGHLVATAERLIHKAIKEGEQ